MQRYFKEYEEGVYDCWILVQEYFKNELNIDIPSYEKVYSARLRKNFKEFLLKDAGIIYKEIDKPQKDCIVLIKGDPYHSGVAINEKEMLHCMQGIDTKIERINNYEVIGLYMVQRVVSR